MHLPFIIYYHLHKEAIETTAAKYLHIFDLSWDTLCNKTILDIGSGTNYFALACRKRGIQIWSIDPKIHETSSYIRFLQSDYESIATTLKDNSFDVILALGSISLTSNTGKMKHYIQDSMRLLKPNGELRFFPAMINEPITKKYIQRIGNKGISREEADNRQKDCIAFIQRIHSASSAHKMRNFSGLKLNQYFLVKK